MLTNKHYVARLLIYGIRDAKTCKFWPACCGLIFYTVCWATGTQLITVYIPPYVFHCKMKCYGSCWLC